MTRNRSITLLGGAAVIPLTALAVGCGGSSSGGATAAAPQPKAQAPAQNASAHSATVRVANSRLGKILVDSRGRTLYLFKKDSGTKSACFGMCASFWPPLRTSGKPMVGSGARSSLVGTTRRSDGASQVTYNGHPLYGFMMDKKPGDTKGEGVTAFGGRWFAISPAGKQVSPKAAKSSGSSSSPAPAAPKPAAPKPAPKPAAPKPAPKPAAPKPAPPANSGIPQNGGGDGDSDNNGGPSDGDGNV
jgi:predicted lipoprotein with Yx(FWY)xxD motif